jgi:hypothetical protein
MAAGRKVLSANAAEHLHRPVDMLGYLYGKKFGPKNSMSAVSSLCTCGLHVGHCPPQPVPYSAPPHITILLIGSGRIRLDLC